MVKSVLGTNHQGLREWLVQRITAVIMAVYSVGMIAYFLLNPNLDFIDWHTLFVHTGMKVATILFVTSMLYHTWIGMWTVITDYIKPMVLALLAHMVILLTLVACFFWALEILWGI
jgi:succinate dehydrogenase / fumarate reductase, membrane anchor subunit